MNLSSFGRFVFNHVFAELVARRMIYAAEAPPELPSHADILRERYTEGRLYWASAGPTFFNDPDGLMTKLFEHALRTALRLAPQPFHAVVGGNAGAAIEELLKVHNLVANEAGFAHQLSQLAIMFSRPGQSVAGYTGNTRLAFPTASLDRQGNMLALLGDAISISAMGLGTGAERMRFGGWAKLAELNLEQPAHTGAFVISFPFLHKEERRRTCDWDELFRQHAVACGSIGVKDALTLGQFPIYHVDSAADCERVGNELGAEMAARMALRLRQLAIEAPIVLKEITRAEKCYAAASAAGHLDPD